MISQAFGLTVWCFQLRPVSLQEVMRRPTSPVITARKGLRISVRRSGCWGSMRPWDTDSEVAGWWCGSWLSFAGWDGEDQAGEFISCPVGRATEVHLFHRVNSWVDAINTPSEYRYTA